MIYAYGDRAAGWAMAALWILTEFSLFIYFKQKIPRRLEERGKVWAIWAVCWVLLTGLQIGQARIPFLCNYLLRLLLLALYTKVVDQASFFLAGYVTFLFYLVKDICKMTMLDVACPALHLAVVEDPWINAGSMTLCAAMQFLILRKVRQIVAMDGHLHLKRAERSAILFPVIPYALIKYLQMDSYTYGKMPGEFLSVVCLMLCICDLVILLQTESVIVAQRIAAESEALRVRFQSQQEWYCQEREKIRAIDKIYHDMKHHLHYISTLSDNEKIREYIRSIAGDMDASGAFPTTGNEVIDSVLARYGGKCARTRVRLIPTVNGKAFSFMEPKDLLVIIGNALDNAWEAVSQVAQEEKREIVVRVDRRKDFAVMRVENHFAGSVDVGRNGEIKTTKEDAGEHGFGIQNIRSAARRYGGEASVEVEGEMFILTVVVPVREL